MRGRLTGLLWASLAGWALSGSLWSEESSGITVMGTGIVTAKPSAVEITTEVTGKAELASDALVKYKDAKRRALKAVEELKIPQLSIVEGGLNVNAGNEATQQMRAMMGQGADPKIQVEVTERLTLTLKGVDKMDPAALTETLSRITDGAKDAGLSLGTGPKNYYEMQVRGGKTASPVVFVIPDATELRRKASELAVEDAKAKAQRLAGMAGLKLGAIRAIQEGPEVKDAGTAAMMQIWWSMAAQGDSEEKSLAKIMSPTWGDMPVRVDLRLQFEIAK